MTFPWRAVFILCCGLSLLSAVGESADDAPSPLSDAGRSALHKQLDEAILRLTPRIKQMPDDVSLYSKRGDLHFFRAQFPAAIDDYQKMLELKPELEKSHWRLGLAYYYAGQYPAAARQFELFRSIDDVDRENGIWHFLSLVKEQGVTKARSRILPYTKGDREPFPDLYRMFAGKLSSDDVLARIAKAELDSSERNKRLFYAQLYIGLNLIVEEHPEEAREFLKRAVNNPWPQRSGGGPHYMWQLARVQYELLQDQRARSKGK